VEDEKQWLIEIGSSVHEIKAATREDAILQAWKLHKGTVGVIIVTRRLGESDDDSVPWRVVDVLYRILGDYPEAKRVDDFCVSAGIPSVLPPMA